MGGMMGGMTGMTDAGTDRMLQECKAMMAECMAHHSTEGDIQMTYDECDAMMEH